jgi:hypothetical protein
LHISWCECSALQNYSSTSMAVQQPCLRHKQGWWQPCPGAAAVGALPNIASLQPLPAPVHFKHKSNCSDTIKGRWPQNRCAGTLGGSATMPVLPPLPAGTGAAAGRSPVPSCASAAQGKKRKLASFRTFHCYGETSAQTSLREPYRCTHATHARDWRDRMGKGPPLAPTFETEALYE